MEEQITNEVPGVITEAAAPVETQPVQTDAQTIEQAAQPTVDGQGTPETQESIPYERLKEVIDSKNAVLESNKALQQQLQMSIQQNQIQQNLQQSNQAPQPISKLEEISAKLNGLEDDGTGSINIDEAKQMIVAMQEIVTNNNQARSKDQIDSYLVQNPDFISLVGSEHPMLGTQYAPGFSEMITNNPSAAQHLQSLNANPLEQMKQALSYAREYQKSKITQQQIATINVPGQPLVNGAPPSVSAIPVSHGVNTVASWQAMDNAAFAQYADSMVKT